MDFRNFLKFSSTSTLVSFLESNAAKRMVDVVLVECEDMKTRGGILHSNNDTHGCLHLMRSMAAERSAAAQSRPRAPIVEEKVDR